METISTYIQVHHCLVGVDVRFQQCWESAALLQVACVYVCVQAH